MPECLAWLPEEILDQYRMTSPLLWEEQSMWCIMRPHPNYWDHGKMVFMSANDGDWVWAYDVQDSGRFFDGGSPIVDLDGTVMPSPDYDWEWAPVNAGLADFVAQRCLLEMAHSSVGFTVRGVVPSSLLSGVVAGLAEVPVWPWRERPGLRMHLGEGLLVVSSFERDKIVSLDYSMGNFGSYVIGAAANRNYSMDKLRVAIAAANFSSLGYLSNCGLPDDCTFEDGRSPGRRIKIADFFS